jgi:hypothetical protein
MAISYIASSEITEGSYGTTTIDVPTGADAESWILLVWFVANCPNGFTTPDGFTALHDGSFSNEHVIYLAGQTSGSTIPLDIVNSTSWMSARCAAYSGADGVDVSDFAETTTTGTDSPAVSATTTNDGDQLVLLSNNDGSASPTAPTGWTRRITGSNTVISDKAQATAGATGDVVQTWPDSGNISVGLVALKPADSGDGTLGPGLWASTSSGWKAVTRSAVG